MLLDVFLLGDIATDRLIPKTVSKDRKMETNDQDSAKERERHIRVIVIRHRRGNQAHTVRLRRNRV